MPQSLIDFPMATPEETAMVFEKLDSMLISKERGNSFLADMWLAYVANLGMDSKGQKIIRKWRNGEAVPSEFQLKQLRLLADEVEKLRNFDSDNTIKTFLLGEAMSGDLSKLDLIRLNQFGEFRAEVASFIANG